MLNRFKPDLPPPQPGDYCSLCNYPRLPHERVCGHCLELARDRKAEKELTRERELELVEKLGGWRPYEEYLADKFRPSSVTQPALDACLRFDHERENIYLWSSNPGTGKSHLSVVAARKAFDRGVDGRVLKPNELFREIRQTYDEDATERDGDVISRAVRLPIFVLDDLGTQKDTEWNVSCLYDFVDGRYAHRPGGLIVTANLSLEQARKRWGGRIASRLEQMVGRLCFDLSAEPDHRRIA